VTAGNGNNYDAGNTTRQMKGPGATDLDGRISLTLPACS
jgi:hypothetical protein